MLKDEDSTRRMGSQSALRVGGGFLGPLSEILAPWAWSGARDSEFLTGSQAGPTLPVWGLPAAEHARALWCDAQATRKHCVVRKVTLARSVYVQKAQKGERGGCLGKAG